MTPIEKRKATLQRREEERARLREVKAALTHFLAEHEAGITGGYDGEEYSRAYLVSARDDLVSIELDVE